MSISWIKYTFLVAGVLFLFNCKNGPKGERETDPIFQQDPTLKEITERIYKSPGDGALYFDRGNILHKMQHDSLAIKDFKKATTLDTNNAQYYSAVGDVMFEHKDISGSIPWVEKAIAKNPTDRKAHLKIAKLFLYLKEYGKAFSEINIVLRKNVYDPEAYFLKAIIYKDMKDTAKAISTLQTAVQVAPDFRDAMVQLGIIYSGKKDPIALKYLQNAYRLDTNDVLPLYAQGVFYQEQKDYAKAKEMYHKCIVHDRTYTDAYFNMGYILMQEDSVEKSYRQYDLVTKLDPLNPAAYYNRGLCNEMMDSVKKAIADYRQAVSLDPKYQSPIDALKRLKADK
jgi:tetratricopeptide (TPR) repeat protein